MRLRVLQTLFAIYRFYTDNGMDLDEDIPSLLMGNTTLEERRVIAGWVEPTFHFEARDGSSIQARGCARFLAGHQPTQEHSKFTI